MWHGTSYFRMNCHRDIVDPGERMKEQGQGCVLYSIYLLLPSVRVPFEMYSCINNIVIPLKYNKYLTLLD